MMLATPTQTDAPTVTQTATTLPHGIILDVRSCGDRGRPVLMFLHGFPEGAFIWDDYLRHFADPTHGGYRCVAPNLRGFAGSSAPADVAQYRAKHLVQDVVALIESEVGAAGRLACLIAHDWGGAVAWNVVNQHPHKQAQLCSINSPHLGTFLRELQSSPAQQAASAYMNFLARPDAPALLAQNDFARLWPFFENMGNAAWLTPALKDRYRALWMQGLHGGCNYYAASPLRPDIPSDPHPKAHTDAHVGNGLQQLTFPSSMLTIAIPAQVIWGMQDIALQPALLDGLDAFVPNLQISRVPDASHWITHEQPELVKSLLALQLARRVP